MRKTFVYRCRLSIFSVILLLTYSFTTAAETLAPGYGQLPFPLPEPGTYELPVLGLAGDGTVLNADGESTQLHQLLEGKHTVLTFMYSTCSDINGCPLSAYVFYKLKSLMSKDENLANKLQLISLSFDPERDTPAVMKLYSNNFSYQKKQGDWHFLTTSSQKHLQPLLQSYNQDLQRFYSMEDNSRSDYAHILRVFLIDPNKQIRNIYSVGYLHPQVIVNDLQTLFLPETSKKTTSNSAAHVALQIDKPGDDKTGYLTPEYQSSSRAIESRNGQLYSLLENTTSPPLGLPKLPPETLASLSKQKIRLGQKLFFDRRLSLNQTFSCAMCHIPEQGFTSNELSTAVGIEGRTVRRNSPTLYNVAYYKNYFHDARENSLNHQAWGPLLAKNEMGNPSIGFVLDRINKLGDYRGLFEQVYQGKSVSMSSLGDALAAYQITLNSANSPFDRWYFKQQSDAITENAKHGFKLFSGKARCSTCHSINSDYALFTDQKLHNTGVGYNESMGIKPESRRLVLAPGVFVDVKQSLIDSVSEKTPSDLGYYEITQNPKDRWRYKTPSLRNIALTSPYMHNGSLPTLEDVVEFYNHGGVTNEVLDPLIMPLNLDKEEVLDIVAFLQSLTGSNTRAIVSDAFAADIGDQQIEGIR